MKFGASLECRTDDYRCVTLMIIVVLLSIFQLIFDNGFTLTQELKDCGELLSMLGLSE